MKGGMKFKLLSREESVIFSNIFCKKEKESVYFHIKGIGNVI
jgi:hypothetical protein